MSDEKNLNDFIKDDVDTIGEGVREVINIILQFFTHKMTYTLIKGDMLFYVLFMFRMLFTPLIGSMIDDKLYGIASQLVFCYFIGLSVYQHYRRKFLQQDWRNVKFDQSSKLH